MLSSGSRKKGQSYRSGSPATAHLLPQGLPHFGAEMIPCFPIWHKPPVFLRSASLTRIACTEIPFSRASFFPGRFRRRVLRCTNREHSREERPGCAQFQHAPFY